MRAGRWAILATTAAAVLGLGADGPAERLDQPTMVRLDFRDYTVAGVVQALAKRTGKPLSDQRGETTKDEFELPQRGELGAGKGIPRKVTLEAPEPVPLWEAIDRLAAAGGSGYRVGFQGDIGRQSFAVVFAEGIEPPGPACYGGPFRVALLGAHEYRDVLLVRGPWLKFYDSGVPVPADAAELASAPSDGGPFHVELGLTVEPGLLARRLGPLAELEAVDEAGRSLLAAPREKEPQSFGEFVGLDSYVSHVVRIPLKRAGGDRPSRTIARLRGVVPVEAAKLQPEAAVTLKLGDAEGQVARGGGAEFTVEADRTLPDGVLRLVIIGRLVGDLPPAARAARLDELRSHQWRVVDGRGEPIGASSTSIGDDGRGNVRLQFDFAPVDMGFGPPAEFRYYDFDRASVRVPFEFRDITLP